MIRINLLPTEGPGPTKVYVELVFGLIFIAIAAIGIGFYWNYLNEIIESRHQEIAHKKEQIRKLQDIIKQVEKFEREKEILQTKLDLIKQLRQNQQGPVNLLDELSKSVPDNIWYGELSESNGHITVRGGTLSLMALGDFVNKLEEEGSLFQNVKVKGARKGVVQERDVYGFALEMDIKPPSQPSEQQTESQP